MVFVIQLFELIRTLGTDADLQPFPPILGLSSQCHSTGNPKLHIYNPSQHSTIKQSSQPTSLSSSTFTFVVLCVCECICVHPCVDIQMKVRVQPHLSFLIHLGFRIWPLCMSGSHELCRFPHQGVPEIHLSPAPQIWDLLLYQGIKLRSSCM